MTEDLQYVGGNYPVHDVAQKVTGELVYGSDFSVPGMLHAKLILSTIPHGNVKRIDASRAEALPGVVKVFSHENSPMDTFCRARIHPGQDLAMHDETLFSERVRFVGDRVAAVVATSRATAEAAAALVEVEYEELPPMLTIDDALAPDALPIHPVGNVVYEHEIDKGERPDLEGALVVSTTTTTPRVHHAALEPHVCIAQGHSTGGMTVWTTSQGVYAARTVIAELLHMEYHRLRVIKVPMGGSFGGKTEYIIEPVCAFLAHATRRPVKLLLDREECMVATMVRPATATTIRTACTLEGELLDFEAASTLDSGAYASSTPDYSVHMCKKVTKLYRVPHYQHQGRAVLTNTPVGRRLLAAGAPPRWRRPPRSTWTGWRPRCGSTRSNSASRTWSSPSTPTSSPACRSATRACASASSAAPWPSTGPRAGPAPRGGAASGAASASPPARTRTACSARSPRRAAWASR